jgi:L-alanine-DL-glutamate epimerase-like enolase superfamily enzyme
MVSDLKITDVEVITCDGGFRTWIFVKIETDEGLTGYGDCSVWSFPRSVVEAVRFLSTEIIGEDPGDIERLWWKMWSKTTRLLGGIAQIGLAGIDNALWDLKGKALDVPVYELLGGPYREDLRLYWSHCGTHRVFRPEVVGKPGIDSYEGIEELGREVVERGFTALKTNIFNPTSPREGGLGSYRKGYYPANIDGRTLRDGVELIRSFRSGVEDEADIILDEAGKFDTPSGLKLARSLEPYNLLFLEEPIPPENPWACLEIKSSTTTPICMSEGLYSTNAYQGFLRLGAIDVAMPDIAWVGLTMGMRIARQCQTHYIPIAPHSPHSPLCTIITGHFCASIPNFLIQEIEVDDVPWRDQVISEPLKIEEGYLKLSGRPGFGVDLNLDEIEGHPIKERD